jgi:hypothetical protein
MAAAAKSRMIPSTAHPDRDVMSEARQRTPGAWPRYRALILLCGLAACTGSPATLAVPPNFDIMTPTGAASVSIRTSPPGMTDAEFAHLVRTGMERETHSITIASGRVPPFPTQRIVWHVNLSFPNTDSRLVVNVFDGRTPFAYEQATISNDTPNEIITADIESMSQRLLAKVAARANVPPQRSQSGPAAKA